MNSDADLPEQIVIPGEDPAFLAVPADVSDLVIRIRPLDRDGRVVVVLDGELDLHAASRVRVALTDAAHVSRCRGVYVDLSQVTFVDSIGLGVLVSGMKAAISAGVPFVLRDPQPQVRRILAITGLDKAFQIDPPGVPGQRSASA